MEKSTKMYYTMGEVSKLFNVNASLLRFWEKEFSVLKPKKNAKGNRLFTQKDVDHLHIIYDLVKVKGFTLEGAKNKMKGGLSTEFDQVELLKSLKNVRSFLIELKQGL